MSGALPVNGIEGLASLKEVNIPETIFNQPEPQAPQRAGFNELLDIAVSSISETQTTADSAIKNLAAGNDVSLHNVALAVQKANLTLQLALQVKNKITEAYQEVTRMQI